MKKANIAVVGATGVVGRAFLDVLAARQVPIDKLYLFASARSAGTQITFNGKTHTIEELSEDSFKRQIDAALFSAGGSIAAKFAPVAAQSGCLVIDNSSAWRMAAHVPLVVPEVNGGDIAAHQGIIANPNCSTIQSVVALKPLMDAFGLNRVAYTTYQAVSGAGMGGVLDLERGGKGEAPTTFAHPIAANCIPHIDDFLESGYTKEEQKMIDETRKILHASQLKVTATCVRVPVHTGHCVAINAELARPFEIKDVIGILQKAQGVVVQNDDAAQHYPMPIHATGRDEVFVGRIRRDESVANGLHAWVVSDNLRKGAALNAVQILE